MHEMLESLVFFVNQVAMQSSLDNFFCADNASSSDEVIVIEDNEEVHEKMQDVNLEECEDGSAEYDNMVCSSECCKLDHPGPNQPTSTSVLNATMRIQGEGRMQQVQVVQAKWFSLYPWLTLCETRHKLFCFYCCNAVHKNLLTFSKKAKIHGFL